MIRFDDIEAQETSGTLPGVSDFKIMFYNAFRLLL